MSGSPIQMDHIPILFPTNQEHHLRQYHLKENELVLLSDLEWFDSDMVYCMSSRTDVKDWLGPPGIAFYSSELHVNSLTPPECRIGRDQMVTPNSYPVCNT